MTSILTNTSAMVALQTLRTTSKSLTNTQQQVSSGLRVQTATQNAAYWSISTTMRSDAKAVAAVAEALGLGAAKVDVAYASLDSTIDVLGEFRTRLVAAREDGVDKAKIQSELNQFKAQLVSIATSASFNSVNWLNTEVPQNLSELSSLPASITSSFIRNADGSVRVGQTEIDVAAISLFNVGGGGALQADIRALGDIGGLRNADINSSSHAGRMMWQMTGPFVLDDTDTIAFDMTFDADASYPGETHTVTIRKSTIDAALGTIDGRVADGAEYFEVLMQAFAEAGITDKVGFAGGGGGLGTYGVVYIDTAEATGYQGSSISISNVTDSTGGDAGGLSLPPIQDAPGGYATDQFAFTSAFRVYRDVAFSFEFIVNNDLWHRASIDRNLVDATLGTSDGWIHSAADLAAILNVALSGTGLAVSSDSGSVVFDVDPSVYPDMGKRSSLQLRNVSDTLGSLPDFDILDVDVTDPAKSIDNYIFGLDGMLQKVISGAAALGAAKSRIEMLANFTQTMMDTIGTGIGRLVDADMNEASTRLKALQVQQQLAIQALQIANGNAENLLQLFRQAA